MFYSFGLACALFSIFNSVKGDDDDEGVTLLGTFDMGFPSESVEYDSINSAYYYFSAFTNLPAMLDASNLTAILNGDVLATYPFDMGNYSDTIFFPTAMFTDGDTLYVNTYTGEIVLIDLETYKAYDSWWIFYDISTYTVANLNGMCYDNDNDLLYVTDTGLNATTFSSNTNQGMIYSVSLEDGTYSMVYDSSENDDKLIYPNGCTIRDGILYATEVGYDRNSTLIVYNIEENSWNFYDQPTRGDGIVFSDDGDLFISAFDVPGGSGDGLYMISASSISSDEYTFELVLDDLVSPADIAYNGEDSVILIPTLDTDTFVNVIYFVEIDEDTNGDDDDTSESDSDNVYSIKNNSINFVNIGCIVTIIGYILAGEIV